ncbi:MAG: hypothetical protein ABIG96_06135 [Candidatus Micrarchaeota archaeon]
MENVVSQLKEAGWNVANGSSRNRAVEKSYSPGWPLFFFSFWVSGSFEKTGDQNE